MFNFADPTLKSLGSLVAVTLPPSSALYTRRGSVIGVNVDVSPDAVTSSTATATSSPSSAVRSSLELSLISQKFPFISTKIVSTRPATLLLTSSASPSISTSSNSTSNSGSGAHAIVISPTADQDWVIPDRDSVLAWAGQPGSSGSNSTPESVFSSQKYGALRVHGIAKDPLSPLNPQIAISASGSASGTVLEVKLLQNESIYVHPGSVLAYSIPKGEKAVEELETIEHKTSLPQLPAEESAKTKSFLQKVSEIVKIPVPAFFQSYATSTRNNIHRWLYKGDDMLLKLSGPKTVLIAPGSKQATALNPPLVTQKGLEALVGSALETK